MTESMVNRDRLKNGTGLTGGAVKVNGNGLTRIEGWEMTEDEKLVKKGRKWWRLK